MHYLLYCGMCVAPVGIGCAVWVQISFKYKRIIFTKQEILVNFIYFSFLCCFSSHIFNMNFLRRFFVLYFSLFNTGLVAMF